MRVHRFFIKNIIRPTGLIKIENEKLIHQWRRVLRFKTGQEVVLFDNSGLEFSGVIVSFGDKTAEIELKSSQSGPVPPLPLFLYLSLTKREAFEWAIEKGTELGVAGFVPVISARSEKKSLNLERVQKILTEASEQSGRVILPEISEPISLEESLTRLQGKTIVLDPRGEPFKIADYKTDQRVNIFIGPEGGYEPEEIKLFHKNNIPVVVLGTQILRAETAAITISSVLLVS